MDLATPRITLDSLQPLTGIATASYLTAAEKLAVALSRERFAVIKLPQHMADVLKPALEKLLAADTCSLPGCNVREWRVGGRGNSPDLELAHNVMNSVARAVLSALCRSSMLRLRGDAFSPLFSPISAGHLMEDLECLRTPARLAACTLDQHRGAAAHAAWDELQATRKRGKKRSISASGAPSSGPVTRSAAVRGSAQGAAVQETGSRKKGRAGVTEADKENGGMELDDAGPLTRRRSSGQGRSSSAGGAATRPGMASTGGRVDRRGSLEGGRGGATLVILRGRPCLVLDDCLRQDPAGCLSLCVRSVTGVERWFYCSASTRCGAVFEMYCARLGIELGAVNFMLRGERVFGAATPAAIGMADGDQLTAVLDGSNKLLQQALKVGLHPLYSAVFGKQADELEMNCCLPSLY